MRKIFDHFGSTILQRQMFDESTEKRKTENGERANIRTSSAASSGLRRVVLSEVQRSPSQIATMRQFMSQMSNQRNKQTLCLAAGLGVGLEFE
jgi:hypothetical protein